MSGGRRGSKLDEPGGETIRIEITANNNYVVAKTATIGETLGGGVYRYTLSDGREITHKRSRGNVSLANKILNL